MRQRAQGWCSGMTLRDGIIPQGRKEGGRSGWGTHVHPWLIHVNVWQKPPQYCKVISLQLKLKQNKQTKNKVKKIQNNKKKWRGFHGIPSYPGGSCSDIKEENMYALSVYCITGLC